MNDLEIAIAFIVLALSVWAVLAAGDFWKQMRGSSEL